MASFLKILNKANAGEVKINEIMKELASDSTLKPQMKEAAALVPRLIKALTKFSPERKANMQKIKATNEKQMLTDARCFFKERFNAEIAVYSEEDKERYDPKNRGLMAMPYQPAIFIE